MYATVPSTQWVRLPLPPHTSCGPTPRPEQRAHVSRPRPSQCGHRTRPRPEQPGQAASGVPHTAQVTRGAPGAVARGPVAAGRAFTVRVRRPPLFSHSVQGATSRHRPHAGGSLRQVQSCRPLPEQLAHRIVPLSHGQGTSRWECARSRVTLPGSSGGVSRWSATAPS
ncbi:hypothetical protein [Streptomyces sp. IB2014 016-6]|uniref:hypothetical protein n=1 Tax=Streptomyces sp. IB2014 016-6 TaxID=2517818 RepID=UPI0011C9FBBF|nr:hypothetical protein [Streptomyces sp. IB2014 016-6]TXL87579.1 hypothetical protein EW053_21850 [Streptomyces sp. IB2014 016-6]